MAAVKKEREQDPKTATPSGDGAQISCARCAERISLDEEGHLPKGAISRGRNKGTTFCGMCNAVGVKLYRAHISAATLNPLPQEAKAEFWRQARSATSAQMQDHVKRALVKYKTAEKSEGTEAKFMPLKYYTDMGFDGKKIVDLAKPEDVRESPLGVLYRVHIEVAQHMIKEGTTRSDTLIASPKRKHAGKGTSQSKKGKVCIASLDPNPSKWTAEEYEAWQAHAVKEAQQLSTLMTEKISGDTAYLHAPQYVKEDYEKLRDDIVTFETTICSQPQDQFMTAHTHVLGQLLDRYKPLLKSAQAFFKAHHAYGVAPEPKATPAPKGGSKKDPSSKGNGKAKGKEDPSSKGKGKAKGKGK